MSTLTSTLPPQLPTMLTYPEVPIHAVLAGAARDYGTRVALVHGARAISYEQLWQRARQFAFRLYENGIGAGDVVALHMPNCIEFAVAYYGILAAGAVYTPANPLLPAQDLAFQLNDSAAAAVVTHDVSASTLAAVRAQTQVRLVVHVGNRPLPQAVAFDEFIDTDSQFDQLLSREHVDELAHIAYTGGTTGRSKGVELTHRNVVSNIVQFAAWNHGALHRCDLVGALRFRQVGTPADWPVRLGTGAAINLTPWFHAMGCIGSLSVPFAAGVTLILHERFNAARYLADAELYKVTALSGAPALYAALLASPDLYTRNLNSVRNISSGAGPLPHNHIHALRQRFPDAVIAEGYGLTEATMGVAIGPTWASGASKPGTVGVPVFDTAIKLVDPESGAESAVGERGEILVRGPQVMRGYRRRPEDNADVLQEGWLRTGDIGIFDQDGYLAIVDRSKDMLIYKGYNVYPRELEEHLVDRPDVHGAAVVGRPDDTVGEIPVAFVVPTPGHVIDPEALKAEVNAELLPYKRLKQVFVLDALPLSDAGKVLKRVLRDRLLDSAPSWNSHRTACGGSAAT